jgi:hypothetical protein
MIILEDKIMNKLTYEFHKGCENILSIDLLNGYSVKAIKIWNKDKHNYSVEFHLKENTVDDWKLIDEAESVEFNTNYKYINSAILKYVAESLEAGFFNHYIDRYEYELKCFDKGDDYYEKERLCDIDAG